MPRRPIFPRICIALGFDDAEELISHARREADSGGSFLEFRLDYLQRPEQGLEAIRRFHAEYPDCLVLCTCRRHQNKGRFDGSIEEQIRLLENAVLAGAKAIDLEIESAESAVESLERLRAGSQLIVSYHNFSGSAGVETILRRMMKIPAAAYKIVTTARRPSDIFRVLCLGRSASRVPLIVLAMGEIGFPSRVLSPVYGGIYTYAAPAAAEGTAAGQVSIKQLRHLYRVEKLSRSTAIYGVIADPVGHSISPYVHNRAFQSRRIDAVYVPFRVPAAQLKDFFLLAEKLPVAGFSVTIPHKQKVIRYLDVVDPLARRIGAVNTVWRKAGKWRGANTDVEGIVAPLAKQIRLPKSSVLVAGNGGAARAAVFALAEQGAKVSVVARNIERARALARACGGEAVPRENLTSRHFDALVHATPLGMHPRVGECFFDHDIPADVVFDMVYNPMETELIRRAREGKRTVIPGARMFVEQAVRQFETWTGSSAPRAAMERAVQEALGPQPESIM
ncbi:MAG: shikimate dehydrogenase [Bryobacteraceae bacterium]|nr:shikimate dehydrogenase [Bryobacteraceae bacterium]